MNIDHMAKQLVRQRREPQMRSGMAGRSRLCAFLQEGLLNEPGCDELLVDACERGAGSIGGVPYPGSVPHGQIARTVYRRRIATSMSTLTSALRDVDIAPPELAGVIYPAHDSGA